ncbi:unnamed protein product, partial [Scytosiphon promiscuus]
SLVAQVCTALELMHENNLVHNDVKAENILVFSGETGSARTAKLTDLGLALGERPVCDVAGLCG